MSVLLDPDKDYLPYAHQFDNWKHEIHEYRHVEPGLWMPWSGSFDMQIQRVTWTMTSIEVNTDLDPALFQPPVLIGTKHDGWDERSHAETLDVSIDERTGQPLTNPPRATPSSNWPIIAGLAALVFLAVKLFSPRHPPRPSPPK